MGHVGRARGDHGGGDGRDRPAWRRLSRHLDAAYVRQGVPRGPAQHAARVQDASRWAGDGARRRRRLARAPRLGVRDEHGGRQVPRLRRGGGVRGQLASLRRGGLLLQDRRGAGRDRHGHVGHARGQHGADLRRRARDGHEPDRLRRAGPSQAAVLARHGHDHRRRGQGESLQAEPQAAAERLGGGRRRARTSPTRRTPSATSSTSPRAASRRSAARATRAATRGMGSR